MLCCSNLHCTESAWISAALDLVTYTGHGHMVWQQHLEAVPIAQRCDEVPSAFPSAYTAGRGDLRHAVSRLHPQNSANDEQDWLQNAHLM